MRNTETPHRRSKAGTLRRILALILLGGVGTVCISLGLWQLDRAAERDALHQTIEHGRQQPPVQLTPASNPTDLLPWRPAMAQGRWLDDYALLLQNRNLDGRPGYWLVTPLVLDTPPLPSTRHDAVSAGSAELDAVTGRTDTRDFLSRGPTGRNTAVLVLRGWLPRDMQSGAVPTVPQEDGLLQVQGELHTHVPRIFELWQWAGGAESRLPVSLPASDGSLPQVQNLDLSEYAKATGLTILPTVLAQTMPSVALEAYSPASPATPASPLVREWPGPSLDSDQNRGYALQWFGFSAIALIAALFVIRGLFRRTRRDDTL